MIIKDRAYITILATVNPDDIYFVDCVIADLEKKGSIFIKLDLVERKVYFDTPEKAISNNEKWLRELGRDLERTTGFLLLSRLVKEKKTIEKKGFISSIMDSFNEILDIFNSNTNTEEWYNKKDYYNKKKHL